MVFILSKLTIKDSETRLVRYDLTYFNATRDSFECTITLRHHDLLVIYIPAMPLTPQNLDYIKRQRDSFLHGFPGPDFPQFETAPKRGESTYVKKGVITDIHSAGLRAMGLGNEPFNLEGTTGSERRMLEIANEVLYKD